jgi:hypothetical protein
MRKTLVLAMLCLISTSLLAQKLNQNIRGKVIDNDSRQPLIGVNLILLGSDPLIGTATNNSGEFKFNKLPLGRYNIQVQYIGYQPKTVNNVLIGSGKEVVLHIELEESVEQLSEVLIKAQRHKSEPLNKMAMVSARSFSVEETKRYAGSLDDPSRMASAFAGVTGDPSGNNDIVIRGNSPRGLLWRLEGIEIPNPNHFAEEGASGGPISILNSNMLANSDFFTGAFPAEYGNAYSGVFDIKLRNGNNEQREYSTRLGILGVDFSAEGPFKENGKASYLANYRYSSLSLLNAIGINVAGDAVPKFQDVALNVSLPTKKMGTFKIFGVGGISNITETDIDYINDFETDMGVLGVSNTLSIDNQSYLKTTLAFTGSINDWTYQELEDGQFLKKGREDFKYYSYKTKMVYNRKMNARNTLNTGTTFSNLNYHLFSEFYDNELKQLIPEVDESGKTNLLESYINWRFRLSDDLTIQAGFHHTYFFLNKNQALEPRLGAKWQFNETQSLSAGIGLHSKVESLTNYLAFDELEDGTRLQYNKDLDFSKAWHYVLAYENLLSRNLFLKVETYYQNLFNIPIEDDPASSFSALNFTEGYTTKRLVNKGLGYNYGLELTLEKYFSKNYYFLITGSVFESKYKTADGIWRDTRYNGNYVCNFLAGKEFKIKNNGIISTLSTSLRASMAGGVRYTPIDLEQSIIDEETVRHDEMAFSEQRDPFMRFDFKVSYRKNKKKTTRVWELDIQNVTNRLNVAGDWYDNDKQEIEEWTQLGLLPTISYRIEF